MSQEQAKPPVAADRVEPISHADRAFIAEFQFQLNQAVTRCALLAGEKARAEAALESQKARLDALEAEMGKLRSDLEVARGASSPAGGGVLAEDASGPKPIH